MHHGAPSGAPSPVYMENTALLPTQSNCNETNSHEGVGVACGAHKGRGSNSKGPRVGLFWLLGVNALVCGVEIVSSAAFTYIPPLLLKAGYTETLMTIILGVAPVLDLLSVPVLAEWSDRCTSVIGRRRPFIMALSAVLLISLIVIPYGPVITSLINGGTNTNVTNMLVLAFGVILLDYSYQALFNPCESLLSDLMAGASEADQTRGFTVYSASISLGCILGYLIVSLDWSSVGFMLGTQEQTAFSVIFLLFLPCLFITLFVSKEKPFRRMPSRVLANLQSDSEKLLKLKTPLTQIKTTTTLNLDLNADEIPVLPDHPSDGGYESESGSSEPEEPINVTLTNSEMLRWRYQRLTYQISRLPRITLQRIINNFFRVLAKVLFFFVLLPYQLVNLPVKTWQRVSNSPTVLRRLFLAELFGWMGFMCHNMFFTDFVGQYVYKGMPDAPEHSELALLYDEGVRMGSWGLFLHSLTACLYAFLIQQHIVRLVGHRAVFVGGLAIFAVTMAATIVSPTMAFLNTVTALSGIGFAALTSTPNMLVTLYNTDRQLFMWDCKKEKRYLGEESGLGADVAVLDMAYFLAQILLSICMGPLVDLTGSSMPYMVVATLAGGVSVYYASRVVFTEGHLKQLRAGNF